MNVWKTIGSWIAYASVLVMPYATYGQKLYWREGNNTDGTVIKRSDLGGANIEALITIPTALNNSFGLALDPDGGKMYWAERENGTIRRANMNGSNPEDILTGLTKPLGIALDKAGGRVYWCQDQGIGEGVYRGNLDGSGTEQLLPNACLDIAVDATGGKVYFIAGLGGPSRANLDGTGLETLIDPSTFVAVFTNAVSWSIALDVAAGRVYFTLHRFFAGTTSSIGRSNLDGSSPERVLSETDLGSPVDLPVGLALDTSQRTLYWGELGHSIYRTNMDGTSPTLIHTLPNGWEATALALDLTAGPGIPALSEWGAALMALILLTVGTIVFLPQRRNLDSAPSTA